jgi:Papain-like cysteine protease AvrRpt2
MNTKSKRNMVIHGLQFLIVFLVIGGLSHVAYADLVWDEFNKIPGQSTSATPALAVFNNNLYCVYKANGSNDIFVTTTGDGQNWSIAYSIPGRTTSATPALSVFNNKLYCLFKAEDTTRRIYVISTSDGQNWSDSYYIPEKTTSAAPAAAVFNNKLYCLYKGREYNDIMITSTSDGQNWSNSDFIIGRTTSAAPALAVFNNKLYCLFKAENTTDRIYVINSSDGQIWSDSYFIPEITTSAAPALTVIDDKLYCLFKSVNSTNNILVIDTSDGQNWSESDLIPGQSTSTAPAVAVFNDLVYCAHKVNNATNEIYVLDAEVGILSILDVNLYAQQTNMWCWAASGEMIMNYLGNNVPQCTQANNRFDRDDCCDDFQNCVIGGWPEFDKYGFNFLRTVWGTALTFDQLKGQFDNNRPVGFAWGWAGGGGHYMVARGVYQNAAGEQFIHVNNPWPWNANKDNGGAAEIITYDEYVAAPGHSTWRNEYDIIEN